MVGALDLNAIDGPAARDQLLDCLVHWLGTTDAALYRNGPDVAANANFTFYTCADQTTCLANEYGGTSFAAPMWAGFIALANQHAATNGKSKVGFLDPTIYPQNVASTYVKDFHDISLQRRLYCSTKCWMRAMRSRTLRKLPRRMACCVMSANQRSTWLSQEA